MVMKLSQTQVMALTDIVLFTILIIGFNIIQFMQKDYTVSF